MSLEVRPARREDAAAIAAVYAEGIAQRRATFVTEPRSEEQIAAWLGERGPVLVAAEGEEVVAFAGLGEYSEVPAYRDIGEFAIYVAGRARGRGVGRTLLAALCDAAERDGRFKVIGKVFPDNEPSLALCRACGFREVGVHRRHGRLDGRWRDVVVLERLLGPAREGEE